MLDVVASTFYLKAGPFASDEFGRYSNELFDEWERYVATHLELSDYAITLVLEEGSVKGRAKIAAGMGAFYLAIAQYGSFVSGLQIIKGQAEYVTDALFEKAKEQFGCESQRGNTKRNGGEIFYLRGLFEKVQRGRLTPNEAISDLQLRWGDEALSSPEFLRDIADNLRVAPRYPTQVPMFDDSSEACFNVDALFSKPVSPPVPRLPPLSEVRISQHYRIEISRSKKGDPKKVKLTKL